MVRLFLALTLLAGCAGVSRSTAAVPIGGASPTVELIAKGTEAARRGDAVRAEQYLSMAIQQGADKSDVLPLLLKSCLRSSHLRTALNHAQPYLLEHPEDDALRFLVAAIHVGLGQSTVARHELEMLLERSPSDPDAHYLIGVIDADIDIPTARAHFEAAIEGTMNDAQRVEIQSRLTALRLRERERAEVAQ